MVEKVNDYYEVLMGRPMDMPGAHAREQRMNRRAIGICFVGKYDELAPNEAMLQRGDDLIEWLLSIYQIPPSNILGHREIGLLAGFDWTKTTRSGLPEFKSCPGAAFDMDKLRARYE